MSVEDQPLMSRIGVFFFFGCLLMILGAVGEWIVGNTFPFVVFGSFGSFAPGTTANEAQSWEQRLMVR